MKHFQSVIFVFSLLTYSSLCELINTTNSESSEQEVKQLKDSLQQLRLEFEELKAQVSELLEPKSIHAVARPKATLYDPSGKSMQFNYGREINPPCLSVPNDFKVQRVEYFDTCVRLFNREQCNGVSKAYYPGSANDTIFDNIQSVGPCFENELEKSIVKWNDEANKKSYIKIKNDDIAFVPDLVTVSVQESDLVRTKSYPIHSFKLGYKDRVEFIRIEVESKDLTPTNETSSKNNNNNSVDLKFYEGLEKNPEDKPGKFFTSALAAQETFPATLKFHNIFPQDSWNLKNQEEIESLVVTYLNEKGNRWVIMFAHVDYLNETTTRPTGINLFIRYSNGEANDFYLTNVAGSVFNDEDGENMV